MLLRHMRWQPPQTPRCIASRFPPRHHGGLRGDQVGTVRDREIDHAVLVLDLNTTPAAELFDVHDESLSASTSALRI